MCEENNISASTDSEMPSETHDCEQCSTSDRKIRKLERDNSFLREHATRLARELSVNQKCSGIDATKINENEHHIDFPPSMLSEEIISPLFLAYDFRIEELGSALEEQGTYLDSLTERCNLLLKENDQMRKAKALDIGKLPQMSSKPNIASSFVDLVDPKHNKAKVN